MVAVHKTRIAAEVSAVFLFTFLKSLLAVSYTHLQRKKLAGKTPKEKLLYFWEYYRIPALVTILVIAFAGNLIYTIATAKDSVLSALFINGYSAVSYTHLDVYKRQPLLRQFVTVP